MVVREVVGADRRQTPVLPVSHRGGALDEHLDPLVAGQDEQRGGHRDHDGDHQRRHEALEGVQPALDEPGRAPGLGPAHEGPRHEIGRDHDERVHADRRTDLPGMEAQHLDHADGAQTLNVQAPTTPRRARPTGGLPPGPGQSARTRRASLARGGPPRMRDPPRARRDLLLADLRTLSRDGHDDPHAQRRTASPATGRPRPPGAKDGAEVSGSHGSCAARSGSRTDAPRDRR